MLTHTNPYTALPYTDDPGVFTVEMNNENTLFPSWAGSPLDLPEPYLGEFMKQWNAWLAKKYATTAALDAGWKAGVEPLGAELLKTPATAAGWNVEENNGAAATLTVVNDPGPVLRWTSTVTGTESWSMQLTETALPLVDNTAYTLTFRARMFPGAQATGSIDVGTMIDQADWHGLGFYQTLALGTDWKTFSFVLNPQNTVADHGRLNFSLRNLVTSVDLADVSLKKGAVAGAPAGQTLEAATLGLPPAGGGVGGEAADFGRFLADTENATVGVIATYIKDTLGLKSMLVDTQADYGGQYGLSRAATGDFVDMHAYWQHPTFPGTAWDANNWLINNISQSPLPTAVRSPASASTGSRTSPCR